MNSPSSFAATRMRNRTPYPPRRTTQYRQQRRLTKPCFRREARTGRTLLQFYRISIPEQVESLTYEQIVELVHEQVTVEFPQHKQILDLIIQNLNSNMVFFELTNPVISMVI